MATRRRNKRDRTERLISTALAYAANGWPVLACYTNGLDGCSCSDRHCMSPGKHPQPRISPHGVDSATVDLDEISSWPRDINIAVALGHSGLMALDIDDAEVAQAVLDSEIGQRTGIVRTGRGAHVYFYCDGDTSTRHVRDKTSGRKIGEIRGLGSYVVAPPSHAPAGKRYRWVSAQDSDGLPQVLARVPDAFGYVKKLLRPFGCRAVETRGINAEDVPDDIEVQALADLPREIRYASAILQIRQKMRLKRRAGTAAPKGERSDWEHFDACEVLRAFRAKGITEVDPTVLAGIIKQLDLAFYGKFERQVERGERSRASVDRRYYIAAAQAMDAEGIRIARSDALAEVDIPAAGEEDEAAAAAAAEPAYVWDQGRLYHVRYHQKGSTQHLVADFFPKLVQEITIDRGDEDTDIAWRLSLEKASGRVFNMLLRSSDFDSTASIERAFTRCPQEFIVYSNAYSHLKPAIREISPEESVERIHLYAVPGWWKTDAGRVFLLPGAAGAITQDGIDPALRMRIGDLRLLNEPVANDEFSHYGRGVRASQSRAERATAWKALRSLIQAAPQGISALILLQVLSGTLREAGADISPYLFHVTGKTGAMKTSYSLAALSVLGTFRRTTPPTASWSSASPSALRLIMYSAKDLTLLIDDYKEGGTYDTRGMRELVQNYGDKTSRQRLRSSGEQRPPLPARCAVLSNGEDDWAKESSAVARTITLHIDRNQIDLEKLTAAQQAIDAGELQVIGGDWLTWLCKQPKLFEERRFEKKQEAWQHRFSDNGASEMHRRIPASIAVLGAIGQTFMQFIRSVYPEHEDEARVWMRAAVKLLTETAQERSEDVEESTALEQLLGLLRGEAAAGNVTFFPITGVTEATPRIPNVGPRSSVVGYWMRRKGKLFALLNEPVTWGWYRKEMRTRSEDIMFSWKGFLRQASAKFESRPNERVWIAKPGDRKLQVRVIRIPFESIGLHDRDL